MRKIIFTVFAITIMFFSLTNVFAEVIDCRIISESLRKEIAEIDDSCSIIRVYNGSFLHGFAAGESIENLVSDTYVDEEIFVAYHNGSSKSDFCYIIRDGISYSGDAGQIGGDAFIKYVEGAAIKRIESKTKSHIKTIICLSGETSHDGIYIYFETDNGNYVLFKEYASNETTYLFSIDEFKSIASEYFEKKMNALYDEYGQVRKGSSFSFTDIENIHKYKLSDINTPVWITATVGTAVCLTLVVFISNKYFAKVKKQKIQEPLE